MNEKSLKKFTADILKDFKQALEEQHADELLAKIKAADSAGTFKVVISTSDEDRQGDTLDQTKWKLENYKNNPVVLWAHNYTDLPIGVCTNLSVQNGKLVAEGKFAPADLNPFAGQIASLYEAGFIKATSVGYIQHEDGELELLEFSFVPVPANPFALSVREAKNLNLNIPQLVMKGLSFSTKGAVPFKSHGTADPGAAWDGPAEVKACGDDLDKLKAICAWFDGEKPDVKSSYKLPHHQASDLKAVWRGVAAAMGALLGSRGGVDIPSGDKKGVYNHLKKHYAEFDKEAPDFEKAVELADSWLKGERVPSQFLDLLFYVRKAEKPGDPCEMDDGGTGILADDPDNPGRLICVPAESGKSAKSNENDGDMNNELIKNLKAEHERYGEAVAKAIDDFGEKCMKSEKSGESRDGADNSEYEKAIEEFKSETDNEHADHLEKCMKAIDDNYELEDQKKGIDEFKSAFNNEHEKHVNEFHKSIEEFKKDWPDGDPKGQEKSIQEFTKAIGSELDRHEKAQMDICKDEMGNDKPDEENEKTIQELVQKIGRQISAKNREKIKAIIADAEEHHQKHIAALRDLMGPEGNEGEEQKPDEKSGPAPKNKVEVRDIRSTNDSFEEFMVTRRVLRTVDVAIGDALKDLNKHFREKFPTRR